MSQYYLSKTKRSISREHSQQRERRGNNAGTTSYDNSLRESAIYIFPNPPSNPPSPSQSSNLSVGTDFPLSAIDTVSDSRMSAYAESSPLSAPSDLLSSGSPWEWTPDLRIERAMELQPDATQHRSEDISDQWHVLTRRQGQRSTVDVVHVHQPRAVPENVPDDSDKGWHSYSLPLLPLLLSLLSVDQSTANLLISNSSQSFLFPGSNIVATGDDFDQEAHGCISGQANYARWRLLADDDVQAYKSLRDGLNVAAEYHSDTSPLLSVSMTLCNIVTDLAADRMKGLRNMLCQPSSVD